MLKKFLIGTFVVVGLAIAMTASAAYDFGPTTLKVGSTGQYVMTLQTVVGAVADGVFGPMTKAKVMAWQANNGLVADGVVGPMTKAAMSGASVVTPVTGCSAGALYNAMTGALCTASLPAGCTAGALFSSTTGLSCSAVVTLPAGCTSAIGYSTTTGLSCAGTTPIVGTSGVGTVDSYTLIASLNNEEVGEGKSDVKVYGLDIEVGDSSDISLTAVKLVFDESTGATSNFKDYADDVSVWLGSTKLATVDSNKFTDDNAWTYTVGLPNAKIPAGTTGKLYVAVSGIGNLDTNDATDAWTLDVTSIRWVDGQGAMISEDPTVAARTFTFETTAVAADLEFKLSADDTTVNNAHVIDIHATETTNNIPILSFKVKIEGSDDVKLKDLPVIYATTTQDNVDEMVEGLTLYMDGADVSSVNMATDCVEEWASNGTCTTVGASETYVFHDIDTWLKAGQTYHFLVKADIYGITDTGDVAAGDKIAATLGETQTNLASFDAEDETGTNLADADKTGSVSSTASEVRDIGINVKYISSTATISHAGDINNTTDSDQGTFTITFDVTAFGADMYLDGTKPTEAAAGADIIHVSVSNTDTYVDSNVRSSTGATLGGVLDANGWYLIEQDTTERFTVTYVTTAGADGLFQVSIVSLNYSEAAETGDIE